MSGNSPARAHRALDFNAINRAALERAAEVAERLLPGGRRRGREWMCGCLRGGPGASCKLNLATGRWSDFATGERGGDFISLAAAVAGCRQGEAARLLAVMLGLPAGDDHGQ